MLGISFEQVDKVTFSNKASTDIESYYDKILSTALGLSVTQFVEGDQRILERCFTGLGEFTVAINQPQKIKQYINKYISLFPKLPKTQAAKILKNFIEYPSKIPKTQSLQIQLCSFLIDWCLKEKKNYLKLRIDLKLSHLYLIEKQYKPAITIIEELLKEVRQMDDKHMLVEGELLQSKINFALENRNKAKASLTAARVSANSIYCSSQLLADIDMMNGILFCDEGDYKTAYSYFYESFEAFHSTNDPRSRQALVYLLISQIMSDHSEEVTTFLNGKYGMFYSGPEMEAIRDLNKANTNKSLSEFRDVLIRHNKVLGQDVVIEGRTQILYQNLLEKNIFKVIKPYSRVELDYIAKRLGLDIGIIQQKLSELILDKQIEGTLDQGNGCVILFDDPQGDELYTHTLEHLKGMDNVVNKLFEKSQMLKL